MATTIAFRAAPFNSISSSPSIYSSTSSPPCSAQIFGRQQLRLMSRKISSSISRSSVWGISIKTVDNVNNIETRRNKFRIRAAVFDELSGNLEQVWKKLQGQDRLTKENMKEPMQDIRRALLEADVSLPVVRRFVKSVSEKAIGTEVISGVRPDQQLVKVVNDELVALMGGSVSELEFSEVSPTVILLAGLQGVGKTTACGKLALYLKKRGKSCFLVAADVYRPAAIDQLQMLGERIEVPVFSLGANADPVEIAKQGVERARKEKYDVVVIDTAGRLQVDEGMMEELKRMKKETKPKEILLVVDAMTGQEAASLVSSFNSALGITGAILTKLDGDARGGAALSVREVSGRPIKFVGEGETMSALEPFYPNRMAGRILGMGDVLSFVEKAQELVAKEDADLLQKKMMEANFDFDDFLKQTRLIANMGNMQGVLKYIPGMNKVNPQQIREAEKSIKIMESMINSMTKAERKSPDLLAKSPSRRRRIAKGSGRTQEQVSSLVAQLFQMRTRMKAMSEIMSGKAQMPPGMAGLENLGATKKASPGKAKRKRVASSLPSRGFGAK